MTFGWQGFTLEHPEDWAPVTLTGARQEGYVRIASPARLGFQIRWKSSKGSVDLPSILSSYLARLKQDAKSAKKEFRSDIEEQDGIFLYRYSSAGHGRGAILRSDVCGRIFFLEAVSSKSDSLLPTFRSLLKSFRADDEQDRWALFGLDLQLPKGLEIEKKVLQAGRTQLTLKAKGVLIEAERWGFAEQLIAKHGLEPWARSVLQLPKAELETSDEGLHLTVPGSFGRSPVNSLVRFQASENRIVAVKVTTRDEAWRPQWDWFV